METGPNSTPKIIPLLPVSGKKMLVMAGKTKDREEKVRYGRAGGVVESFLCLPVFLLFLWPLRERTTFSVNSR
jgi:hypothetical protein